MNWLTNVVRPKIRSILRRETPENLWIKCPDSGQLVFYKDVEANRFVIEAIKERLPIWKRERFADGSEWRRPGA